MASACAVGAWDTAVQGVQLLLPGCPLEGCLRLLQVVPVLRHQCTNPPMAWDWCLCSVPDRIAWQFLNRS